jgi:hypothetical protein
MGNGNVLCKKGAGRPHKKSQSSMGYFSAACGNLSVVLTDNFIFLR